MGIYNTVNKILPIETFKGFLRKNLDYILPMPKKSHDLTAISITEETKQAVKAEALKRNCFEYEIIEAAVKDYLK